jgi:tRNA (cytidine/uridine-2'-O-)-methyltransferase
MFHLVLVEPEIPPNTGNIIRLCANSGARLHLVRPLGFDLDARSVRRSGLDYDELAEVCVHADFGACVAALGAARLLAIETGAARRYDAAGFRAGDALVFGSESRGLAPNIRAVIPEEQCFAIPMRPGNRSLNLANAAALVLYEAWRQNGFAGAQWADAGPQRRPPEDSAVSRIRPLPDGA